MGGGVSKDDTYKLRAVQNSAYSPCAVQGVAGVSGVSGVQKVQNKGGKTIVMHGQKTKTAVHPSPEKPHTHNAHNKHDKKGVLNRAPSRSGGMHTEGDGSPGERKNKPLSRAGSKLTSSTGTTGSGGNFSSKPPTPEGWEDDTSPNSPGSVGSLTRQTSKMSGKHAILRAAR
jgi:hypothetical protein